MLGNARISISSVLAAVLACCVGTPAMGEEPASVDSSPRDGVLLLRNGEIIQGRITRTGDFCLVVVPNGELRVKVSDIDARCDSLEDGYQLKRSLIRLGTAQEHLQLGQWCERHGLLDRAEEELAAAAAAEPNHPMVGLLRRRIEIARQPAAQAKPPAETVTAGVSLEDLDRMVRGLPPGVVESFTQSVQPILVNNCTASGCHGPRSGGHYSLMKIPAGHPAGRRVTQRNLHATLQWVDRKNPSASPLLKVPLGPHGTAKAAIFGKTQAAEQRRLVEWVYQLDQGESQPTPARVDAQDPQLHQAMPSPDQPGAAPLAEPPENLPSSNEGIRPLQIGPCPFDGSDAALAPVGRLQAMSPTEPGAVPARGPRRVDDPQRGRFEPPSRSPSKRGEPPQGFVPADPFDPEIFNRRYHGSGPAPSTAPGNR
jgi:hypothetical protein